jgi:hypothetical protein
MELDQRNLNHMEIDFDLEWVPARVKKLKPRFYKNGEVYICIFGPDAEVGIYGIGETPQQAAIAWEKDLEERIGKLTESDEITHHAIRHLGQH